MHIHNTQFTMHIRSSFSASATTMAVESSTDASLVSRCKRRKENPEYPIQSPCRKRRIKHPDEPEPEPETEPEPSYEFINKLPDAILFEILYRLPYRSAFKFMSVSKRWFSLISHPYFVSRFIHHRHQLGKSDSDPFTLLLYYTPPDIQVHPPKNIYEFRIKSSFNDLLLVYREVPGTARKPGFCKYYIFNPFTKQWLKLPRIPLLRENTSVRVGFICDPYRCDKEHGCFTNVHYRYKVVRIHSPTQSDTTQLYTWHLYYPGSFKFLIWELEDYVNEGTWCRKQRVYLNNLENSKLVKLAKNFSYSKLDFLAFHPKDGEIFFFKFPDYIVQCNSRTRVLEACKLKCTDVSLFLLSRPLWPTPVPSLPFELECPPNC